MTRTNVSARNDKLILLTNDDGIHSPGLRAAAEALGKLGWVTVVAPREQWTGAGRSMPISTRGRIDVHTKLINDDNWEVYAVDGTPAQAVQHGILEIASRKPDLVVSGINYGENVGSGVTISGTVGAALEAAAFGIPAIAVSLETPKEFHLSHSETISFVAAAFFTGLFARLLLTHRFPADVDVLKIEVPAQASVETRWQVARQSRQRYYAPLKPARQSYSIDTRLDYQPEIMDGLEPDSDVATTIVQGLVSVTPLSLDLTSRIDLKAWEQELRNAASE